MNHADPGGMLGGFMNAANYFLSSGDRPEDAAMSGEVVLLGNSQSMNYLSQKEKTYLTNKLRIQGVLHSLCLFILGI